MVAIHHKIKEQVEARKSNIKFRVQSDFNVDPRPTILAKITGVSEKTNVPLGPKDNYTMLVVGTRGMSNIESMMMGSVSVFLLNHSPIPVAVVRSVAKNKGSGSRMDRTSNSRIERGLGGSIAEGPSRIGSLNNAPIRMSSVS